MSFLKIPFNRHFILRIALGCALLVPTFATFSGNGANAATPTNGYLMYRAGALGIFQVKAVNTAGVAQTLPKVFPQSSTVPAVSTDGTKLAWIENVTGMGSTAASVKVANADGTGEITIATHNSMLAHPQFSADKQTLYFSDQSNKIYAVSSTTAGQTVAGTEILTDATQGMLMSFRVSSTGKIAYTTTSAACTGGGTGYGVFLRDVSASGTGTFVPRTCEKLTSNDRPVIGAGQIAWSTDGSKLYVSQTTISEGPGGSALRTEYRIDEFDANGPVSSTPFYSETVDSQSIYEMTVSPDGTKIAFHLVDLDPNNEATPKGVYQLDLVTKSAVQLFPITVFPIGLNWAPVLSGSAITTTTTEVATTTAAPATTVAPATTTTTTLPPAPIAGVTVTDSTIYTRAPRKVASGSAITVLSAAQVKTQRIVSLTPAVCLPAADDIVFIDEGRCNANVLSKKTGAVLRRLRTTVVEDEVTTLGVGNEIVTLAPIYFENGSATVNTRGRNRIKSLTSQINAAGTIMVVGHSGIMLGDTPENRALSRSRATNTVRAIKSAGGSGPFYSIGAGTSSPEVKSTNRNDQAKNRRVVIVLIP